jgi:hypothetical protein
MMRLGQLWQSPVAVGLRRIGFGVLRGTAWILGAISWQLRLIWHRIGARARIVFIIVMLALLSGATRSVAPSISATLQALAVLLLAAVGFWLIVSSPFREGRWWGSH